VISNVFLVALGGMMGAVLRYGVSVGSGRLFGAGFPWGTLVANVSGSLLIGTILVFAGEDIVSVGGRMFLAVGLLGSYTTFSTFSYESLQLIIDGSYGAALANALGQLVAALVAVYLGTVIGRALLGGF
jgi:CrcB protein